MSDIPDVRALGLPDVPYSAFCKVCWQNVYSLWIDKEDHEGVCPFGATEIGGCAQAMDWEQAKGKIKAYFALERSGG